MTGEKTQWNEMKDQKLSLSNNEEIFKKWTEPQEPMWQEQRSLLRVKTKNR